MFCSSCGSQVTTDLQFCPVCGAPQPAQVAAGAPQQLPPPYPSVAVPPALVRASTGRWISESWELVSNDMGMFAVTALVYAGCTSVIPFFLHGPLACGFHIACIRKLRRRTPLDIGDLFKGFNYFVPALVASLLVGVFTTAAALLCLLPGLLVAAIYVFTYMFIVDKKLDFWPAMEASHHVVKNDYFGFSIFMLALIGINILGLLALVVGLLITVPMTFAAITIAYRDVVGFEPNSEF